MGRNKNRHSKDKLYVTVTEHRREKGCKASGSSKTKFAKLPFYCCSLSLAPFTNPVCTSDGMIFDLLHILPYIKKYKKNPVTGTQLSSKDLIKLNFFKNSEEQYHCPVTYKVFTETSKIVAVKPTGNVYSFEAVNQLCIKLQVYKDLLSGEEFSPGDLITLQDPSAPKNVMSFQHMKKQPKSTQQVEEEQEETKLKHSTHTSGLTAASFTSTSIDPKPKNELRQLSEHEIKKKYYNIVSQNNDEGLAKLTTSHGVLKFKLFCAECPMACENFLELCEENYYEGTVFHRSIPGFILQGGDPSATGTGGKNIFGTKYFPDEFSPNLRHAKRGMLSMANSGPNTNKSQFFITYRAAPHLDNKHSVFGELVQGKDTLEVIESLSTDKQDRIKGTYVQILSCEAEKNPFRERKQEFLDEQEGKTFMEEEDWLEIPKPLCLPEAKSSGVGKYLGSSGRGLPEGLFAEYDSVKKSRKYFDFNNW